MILNIFSHTSWLFKYIFCDLSQYFAYLLIGLFSSCIIRVISSLRNISQIISPLLYLVFSSSPWYILTIVAFNFKGPIYQLLSFLAFIFLVYYLSTLSHKYFLLGTFIVVPTTFSSMAYFNLIFMYTIR